MVVNPRFHSTPVNCLLTSTAIKQLLLVVICILGCSPLLVAAQSSSHDWSSVTSSSKTSYSSCSDEGITKCQDEFNRVCRITNQEEICGPCVEGYVEFPTAVVTESSIVNSNETTTEELKALYTCHSIEKLEWALFVSRFQPLYVATAEAMSDSDRLDALLISAKIVSEFNRGTLNRTIELAVDGLVDDGANDFYYENEIVELAINQFAADSPEDTLGLTGYVRPGRGSDTGSDNVFVPNAENPYPPRVDWRERGAVTEVKNQGRCGCCWAISVTGALEGGAAIASNFTWLKTLSHQQLISCDKAHKGCNGGFPAQAFDYANDRGVAEWPDYPYTDGKTGETTKDCNLKGKPIEVEAGEGYKVNYYGEVGDDTFTLRVERLKYALSLGPVAISIKSNCPRLLLYRKGVLTDDGDCKCGPKEDPCHDHAILMVGYNDNAPIPYWIIKNSWGYLWGERGYFRVAQLNPDDGAEDSWGLFGVLGEGIIPKDVYNSTGKTFDKNERRPTWWKLMVACLVILGACILALIFLYVKEHCIDKEPKLVA